MDKPPPPPMFGTKEVMWRVQLSQPLQAQCLFLQMAQVHAGLEPRQPLTSAAHPWGPATGPLPVALSQAGRRARGAGAAPMDRVCSPYLWLKVWRPMEADAKTTDLQKLEV